MFLRRRRRRITTIRVLLRAIYGFIAVLTGIALCQTEMPSIYASFYDALFRRNTVFLGTVFVGAFGIGIGFDTASNKLWDSINRNRQWKDIKHKYVQKDDDDDDDDE